VAQVEFEHVSFAYPGAAARALDDVCLQVERGSFVLVAGPSGSGKTTLLRHLVPALAPHGERAGRVLLDGCPLGELGPREASGRVAFVAQDPAEQLVCDRVWHELAFGLENLGTPQPQMRARVAEMASYLGIGPWFRRDVAELSGGQKQLLNLAAAMVLQPQVLVLDEPTAQLDPIAAGEFLATVRRLNEELGVTVVMTEHRLDEVFALASEVVLMRAGRVQACEAPRDVARDLLAGDDQMALALPVPARVWGATTGGHAAQPSDPAGPPARARGLAGGRAFGWTPASPDACLEQPSDPAGLATGACEPAGAACPLTVREGRAWLAGTLGEGARAATRAAGERRGFSDSLGAKATSPCTAPAGEAGAVVRQGSLGALGGMGALHVNAREVCPLGCGQGFSAGLGAKATSPCTAPAGPALRLRDVWFRYAREGADVLRGASLEVRSGELYALVGANGAGKSTLLRAACGVCVAQRGRVEVLGRDLRSHRGRELFAGRLAMLPQDPASLFVHDTVLAELAEMPPAHPITPARPDARVAEVAELCGVAGLLGRHPRDLSGGERQRVALAKVLLTEPQVVLLDEPTKGLDAAAKLELAGLLGGLCARGVAVLAVSHDVEFCAEHAARVGMLFDGEVVSEGEPRAFFAANAFYTTAARRMGRGLVEGAVTAGELALACRAAAGERDGAR